MKKAPSGAFFNAIPSRRFATRQVEGENTPHPRLARGGSHIFGRGRRHARHRPTGKWVATAFCSRIRASNARPYGLWVATTVWEHIAKEGNYSCPPRLARGEIAAAFCSRMRASNARPYGSWVATTKELKFFILHYSFFIKQKAILLRMAFCGRTIYVRDLLARQKFRKARREGALGRTRTDVRGDRGQPMQRRIAEFMSARISSLRIRPGYTPPLR